MRYEYCLSSSWRLIHMWALCLHRFLESSVQMKQRICKCNPQPWSYLAQGISYGTWTTKRKFKVLGQTRNEHPAAALLEIFAICRGNIRESLVFLQSRSLWKAFSPQDEEADLSQVFWRESRLGWKCTHHQSKATQKFLLLTIAIPVHSLLQELLVQ